MTVARLIPRPRVVVHGAAIDTARNLPNRLLGDVTDRISARAEWLPPVGASIRFEVARAGAAVPTIDSTEAYSIEWQGRSILVRAAEEWGALAGLATLCQALDQGRELRRVDDRPRFAWRGLMIDVARRFMPIETLQAVLDGMWYVKLNVLHLHLSDDQGFRFASTRFPELASADGAYDASALTDLVRRAADRGIRVVPELDVPGHVSSWLLAHPEWAFEGTAPVAPVREFGVHRATLNPANESAMVAVEVLFGELADVFPDEFLHFGGDEVALDDWAADPTVAAWMAREGVASGDVQARFNERVVEAIQTRGRRAIGWDEALHETLDRRVAVEVWRGARGRDNALRAGFDVVVSAPYYLDLFYPGEAHYVYGPADDFTTPDTRVRGIDRMRHVVAGLDWIDAVMTYPDLPAGAKPGRLLGGEACLWSELVSPDLLPERLWSRLPMLADRFWNALPGPIDDLAVTNEWVACTLAERGVARIASPAEDLEMLGRLLEPVKWYRRLLGPGYEIRLAGGREEEAERPYSVDSLLDRTVDSVATESFVSRAIEADLAAGRWPSTDGWRVAEPVLDAYADVALLAAGRALASLADVVDARRTGRPSPLTRADVDACAGPYGEYLLPLAYAIARYL